MRDVHGNDMHLTVMAEAAAQQLAELGAVFTSGHRDMRQQAKAMAVNTCLNREWVGQTYRRGQFIQDWITAHPEAETIPELAEGIYQLLAAMPPDQPLSHHLLTPCPVFDIQPRIDTLGDRIRATIPLLPGFVQFLEREAGLLRWHVEFHALPPVKWA